MLWFTGIFWVKLEIIEISNTWIILTQTRPPRLARLAAWAVKTPRNTEMVSNTAGYGRAILLDRLLIFCHITRVQNTMI